MKKYVYVDYENMGNLKSLVELEGEYFFFIGKTQTSIPKTLVLASNNVKVNWIEIEGTGKNALDFHIAYYLGLRTSDKDVKHYILSKDKGFDPLIASLNKKYGNNFIKRIVSLNDINSGVTVQGQPVVSKVDYAKYNKVLKNLEGIQKIRLPKSEKTLKTYIQAFSKNDNWSEKDIRRIIEELYRQNIISKGNNNRLSYTI